jgi:hypothetical protein
MNNFDGEAAAAFLVLAVALIFGGYRGLRWLGEHVYIEDRPYADFDGWDEQLEERTW